MDPSPPSAANIIRAELKRRGMTHRDLAERLGDTDANITKKLHRGGFSAEWFLTALRAIGVTAPRID